MRLNFTTAATFTGLSLIAGTASAAGAGTGLDVSDAVTSLGLITAAMAAIGAAKIAPAAVAVGWKWVKAAVFG